MTTPEAPSDWEKTWNARESALESVLGKTDGNVLHAMIPFEIGGTADVLHFPNHLPGAHVYSTCELLGEESQQKNALGTYELAVIQRDEDDFGPTLIANLARYTCESLIEPGHNMDLGRAAPSGSNIAGILFADYARFQYESQPAGLLLCIGITRGELRACQQGRHEEVLALLKSNNVYPYTDPARPTLIEHRPWWCFW